VDLALLDINLGQELVYPAAEILADRGVQFVFLTGYDNEHVDPGFRYAPVLQKPFDREALQRALTESSAPPAEETIARKAARA
ncbi:MAG TPA: hypothetical protein VKU03_07860, partial [Roseiarcus sp.]|nr:hypothetical protein [Roseiarcus sp.]